MYNIDQEVYVKGIITGISKENDGKFEYRVTVKSSLYSCGESVKVTADQIKLAAITMDELEKVCKN